MQIINPFQDKKDVLFLKSALNAARALLRTTRSELQEFDLKGSSKKSKKETAEAA